MCSGDNKVQSEWYNDSAEIEKTEIVPTSSHLYLLFDLHIFAVSSLYAELRLPHYI